MGQTGELLSHNVFAYCGNNPVNMSDPSGNMAVVAVGVLVGIGVVAVFLLANFTVQLASAK